MVEKMTAVWLIILTVLVCSAVPALLIWLTATPVAHVAVSLGHTASLYSIVGIL